MTDPGHAAEKIVAFLNSLKTAGGFRLDYTLREFPAAASADERQGAHATGAHAAEITPVTPTTPLLEVTLSGPDASLLLERNGELLHAVESLAASILRLTPEQMEQLSFDCGGFKASRTRAIEQSAHQAVERVRSTGQPFTFPPMNSRERRMLHLALAASGLPTASSGENPRRFVVLYPEGATPQPDAFAPRPPARRDRPGFRPSPHPGSRSGEPFNRSRQPDRPARPPFHPIESPADASEADRDPAGEPLTPAAAREREESIRRAFRKR